MIKITSQSRTQRKKRLPKSKLPIKSNKVAVADMALHGAVAAYSAAIGEDRHVNGLFDDEPGVGISSNSREAQPVDMGSADLVQNPVREGFDDIDTEDNAQSESEDIVDF